MAGRRGSFGSLPLMFPLIIFLFLAQQKALALIYLLLLIWAILPVSSYIFVKIFSFQLKKKVQAFLAVYLFEGALATSVSILAYIKSLEGREIVGIAIATVLIYLTFTVIVLYVRGLEMKINIKSTDDEGLSDRLKSILGTKYTDVPTVSLVPMGTPMVRNVRTITHGEKRIILEQVVKDVLNESEMDSLLLREYSKTLAHWELSFILLLPTVFAVEIDAFLYFYLGGSASLGIFILPVVGALLLLEIVFSPIILVMLSFRPTRASDRFVVKITGNPEALVSAIQKLDNLGASTKLDQGKSAGFFKKLIEREKNKRLATISRMKGP